MKKLGIIVARFQVPQLHDGHIHLIQEVAKHSDHVLIMLGHKVHQPDLRNPFSYRIRESMLKETVLELGLEGKVTIDGIEDSPESNEAWSLELDVLIKKQLDVLSKKYNDTFRVCLYGSRDSFIMYYHGIYDQQIIKETVSMSGTLLREQILSMGEDALKKEHRQGIIYGFKHVYPVGMSVVDCIVYKRDGDVISFLIGRKHRFNKWGIIGGFFDVGIDSSLEDAALRELGEEVGDITVGAPVYLMSKKVDDWRYRDNQHKIVSSLFIMEYISGEPKASDDIEEVTWVELKDLEAAPIHGPHREFIEKAVDYVNRQ